MGVTNNLTEFTNKTSYICGDFNINVLQIQTHDCNCKFYDNMMYVVFVLNITLPTQISETTTTLIDNIYTNNIENHTYQEYYLHILGQNMGM